jgi:hypothetical protein
MSTTGRVTFVSVRGLVVLDPRFGPRLTLFRVASPEVGGRVMPRIASGKGSSSYCTLCAVLSKSRCSCMLSGSVLTRRAYWSIVEGFLLSAESGLSGADIVEPDAKDGVFVLKVERTARRPIDCALVELL